MLTKSRIAVLVSGGGTNLEALLQAQEAGQIPHGEIVLVLSSAAGAYALERAANHGVPAFAVPRKNYFDWHLDSGQGYRTEVTWGETGPVLTLETVTDYRRETGSREL